MLITRLPNSDARLRLRFSPKELNKLVLRGLLSNYDFNFLDRVFFLNALASIFLSFLFLFFVTVVYLLVIHALFFVCLSYAGTVLKLMLLMDL